MGGAHEADKNLRHAKVSQSPCQTRNNGNHAIRSCFAEQRHSTFNYLFAAFVQDGRCDFGTRKISAHKRVEKYDQGTKDHHGCVIKTEQRSEQLAARYEATTYIDREEQQDNQCRNGHKDVLGIVETI